MRRAPIFVNSTENAVTQTLTVSQSAGGQPSAFPFREIIRPLPTPDSRRTPKLLRVSPHKLGGVRNELAVFRVASRIVGSCWCGLESRLVTLEVRNGARTTSDFFITFCHLKQYPSLFITFSLFFSLVDTILKIPLCKPHSFSLIPNVSQVTFLERDWQPCLTYARFIRQQSF